MRLTFPTILLAGAFAAWLPAASAQTPCPSYRPCGAGDTWTGNRLVKQGFFGADFRPACQGHDTCERAPRDCDRQFLRDMYAACENSTDPSRCRRKARNYYMGSRVYHSIVTPLRKLLHTQ
ncbi:hypothetical protein [Aquisphaera insulae]|uniref:hypothetical protein n=1 Tax=Aquisphaera insulae TaxID=2712864 RepID=UPI0013EB1D1E|nr:hypothetical protein [Aquisphaera insulae]